LTRAPGQLRAITASFRQTNGIAGITEAVSDVIEA
jgi:hypothetical protein